MNKQCILNSCLRKYLFLINSDLHVFLFFKAQKFPGQIFQGYGVPQIFVYNSQN